MTDDTQSTGEDFIDPMHQSTLDLLTILDNHRDFEAGEIMSGLMRFERALGQSIDTIKDELSRKPSPSVIYDAMNEPLEMAMRFGAGDLIAVAQRAYKTFADLLDDEDATLTGPATADTFVWITIAGETRIAVKMLFHASMLYGRAPNGKRIEFD